MYYFFSSASLIFFEIEDDDDNSGILDLFISMSSSFLLKDDMNENIESFLLFWGIDDDDDEDNEDNDEDDVDVVKDDDDEDDEDDEDDFGNSFLIISGTSSFLVKEDINENIESFLSFCGIGEDDEDSGIIVLFIFKSWFLIISGTSSFLLKGDMNENIELFLL